jgi:hypothetical protein
MPKKVYEIDTRSAADLSLMKVSFSKTRLMDLKLKMGAPFFSFLQGSV